MSSLLDETAKGRSLLDVYANKQSFKNSNRDELINIIVEHTIFENIHLRPNNFLTIVTEICALFPKEKFAQVRAIYRFVIFNTIVIIVHIFNQEYYFIPRKGKKNPSGKLYTKYVNSRTKKKKIDGHSSTRSEPDSVVKESEEISEIDDSVASALTFPIV